MSYEAKTTKQQALQWIDEAKADRNLQEPWQRDFYRIFMPWRRRPGYFQQVHDQDELYDSTAIGALSDFSADMQSMFTPIEDDWLSVESATTLSKTDAALIAPDLKSYQDEVFSEIRRSNFHEATLEAYPDLAAGTCAMAIQDTGDLTAPLHCQAVPITDLLICRGARGGVDFRAREIFNMKPRDVPVMYPRAKLTREMAARIETDPCGKMIVHECWWPVYDKPAHQRWQYALLIDNVLVDEKVFEGDGCCSLVTARWRTDSTTAWGIGPAYVVLPTAKTLDQLGYLVLKQLSMAVDPPGFYDNDAVINLENGIGPGDWIPRAVGSKVEPLRLEGDFDTSFYERDAMQHEIKRALFQDDPQQTGDTPPSATQWMDQKARKAQRMGAPFGRLTTEWQLAIFQRFAYLLSKRKELPKVKLNGAKIRLRAQSPLIRAQRQQKVIMAGNLLAQAAPMLGQQFPIIVDGGATFQNMRDAMGDELIVIRTPEQQQAITAQIAQAAAAVQNPPQTQ